MLMRESMQYKSNVQQQTFGTPHSALLDVAQLEQGQ